MCEYTVLVNGVKIHSAVITKAENSDRVIIDLYDKGDYLKYLLECDDGKTVNIVVADSRKIYHATATITGFGDSCEIGFTHLVCQCVARFNSRGIAIGIEFNVEYLD